MTGIWRYPFAWLEWVSTTLGSPAKASAQRPARSRIVTGHAPSALGFLLMAPTLTMAQSGVLDTMEIPEVEDGDVTVAFAPRLPPAAARLQSSLEEVASLIRVSPSREPADQYVDCIAASWLFDAHPEEFSRSGEQVRAWLGDGNVQQLADVVKQRMGPVTDPDPESLNYCWWPHESADEEQQKCEVPEGMTEAAREEQVALWGADDLPERDQLQDANCVLLPPDQLPHVTAAYIRQSIWAALPLLAASAEPQDASRIAFKRRYRDAIQTLHQIQRWLAAARVLRDHLTGAQGLLAEEPTAVLVGKLDRLTESLLPWAPAATRASHAAKGDSGEYKATLKALQTEATIPSRKQIESARTAAEETFALAMQALESRIADAVNLALSEVGASLDGRSAALSVLSAHGSMCVLGLRQKAERGDQVSVALSLGFAPVGTCNEALAAPLPRHPSSKQWHESAIVQWPLGVEVHGLLYDPASGRYERPNPRLISVTRDKKLLLESLTSLGVPAWLLQEAQVLEPSAILQGGPLTIRVFAMLPSPLSGGALVRTAVDVKLADGPWKSPEDLARLWIEGLAAGLSNEIAANPVTISLPRRPPVLLKLTLDKLKKEDWLTLATCGAGTEGEDTCVDRERDAFLPLIAGVATITLEHSPPIKLPVELRADVRDGTPRLWVGKPEDPEAFRQFGKAVVARLRDKIPGLNDAIGLLESSTATAEDLLDRVAGELVLLGVREVHRDHVVIRIALDSARSVPLDIKFAEGGVLEIANMEELQEQVDQLAGWFTARAVRILAERAGGTFDRLCEFANDFNSSQWVRLEGDEGEADCNAWSGRDLRLRIAVSPAVDNEHDIAVTGIIPVVTQSMELDFRGAGLVRVHRREGTAFPIDEQAFAAMILKQLGVERLRLPGGGTLKPELRRADDGLYIDLWLNGLFGLERIYAGNIHIGGKTLLADPRTIVDEAIRSAIASPIQDFLMDLAPGLEIEEFRLMGGLIAEDLVATAKTTFGRDSGFPVPAQVTLTVLPTLRLRIDPDADGVIEGLLGQGLGQVAQWLDGVPGISNVTVETNPVRLVLGVEIKLSSLGALYLPRVVIEPRRVHIDFPVAVRTPTIPLPPIALVDPTITIKDRKVRELGLAAKVVPGTEGGESLVYLDATANARLQGESVGVDFTSTLVVARLVEVSRTTGEISEDAVTLQSNITGPLAKVLTLDTGGSIDKEVVQLGGKVGALGEEFAEAKLRFDRHGGFNAIAHAKLLVAEGTIDLSTNSFPKGMELAGTVEMMKLGSEFSLGSGEVWANPEAAGIGFKVGIKKLGSVELALSTAALRDLTPAAILDLLQALLDVRLPSLSELKNFINNPKIDFKISSSFGKSSYKKSKRKARQRPAGSKAPRSAKRETTESDRPKTVAEDGITDPIWLTYGSTDCRCRLKRYGQCLIHYHLRCGLTTGWVDPWEAVSSLQGRWRLLRYTPSSASLEAQEFRAHGNNFPYFVPRAISDMEGTPSTEALRASSTIELVGVHNSFRVVRLTPWQACAADLHEHSPTNAYRELDGGFSLERFVKGLTAESWARNRVTVMRTDRDAIGLVSWNYWAAPSDDPPTLNDMYRKADFGGAEVHMVRYPVHSDAAVVQVGVRQPDARTFHLPIKGIGERLWNQADSQAASTPAWMRTLVNAVSTGPLVHVWPADGKDVRLIAAGNRWEEPFEGRERDDPRVFGNLYHCPDAKECTTWSVLHVGKDQDSTTPLSPVAQTAATMAAVAAWPRSGEAASGLSTPDPGALQAIPGVDLNAFASHDPFSMAIDQLLQEATQEAENGWVYYARAKEDSMRVFVAGVGHKPQRLGIVVASRDEQPKRGWIESGQLRSAAKQMACDRTHVEELATSVEWVRWLEVELARRDSRAICVNVASLLADEVSR